MVQHQWQNCNSFSTQSKETGQKAGDSAGFVHVWHEASSGELGALAGQRGYQSLTIDHGAKGRFPEGLQDQRVDSTPETRELAPSSKLGVSLWASCREGSEAILLEAAQKQAALSFCSTEVAFARAEAGGMQCGWGGDGGGGGRGEEAKRLYCSLA